MDYEKKYKEALERARVWKDKSGMPADKQGILDDIFPELAGSEDERIRKELLEHCINRRDGKQVCIDASDYRRWADWLEKQDPKKHEEELEKAYMTADKVQYRRGYEAATKEVEKQGEQKVVDWNKLIKYNPNSPYIIEESAWSEEDETALGDALWAIKQARTIAKDENDMGNLWYAEDWLKSLKDRVQPQSQNTRKPSDEQMEALRKASKNEYLTAEQYDILVSLYDDLKKLREDKL